MAILTAQQWQDGTGITVTGADLTSITTMCAEVSELITRMCYPILLEPATLTLAAFDAPVGNTLLLPRPVRSITAVHVVRGANGDSSLANATNLLTNFTDYVLNIDDKVNGISRTGMVFRRGTSSWGYELRGSVGKLGAAIENEKVCVFVSGTFGPASVNIIAQGAARTAVTLMFTRRKTGAPLASESWNGYSASTAGPFTATAAVNSPDVLEALRNGGLLPIHIGG